MEGMTNGVAAGQQQAPGLADISAQVQQYQQFLGERRWGRGMRSVAGAVYGEGRGDPDPCLIVLKSKASVSWASRAPPTRQDHAAPRCRPTTSRGPPSLSRIPWRGAGGRPSCCSPHL